MKDQHTKNIGFEKIVDGYALIAKADSRYIGPTIGYALRCGPHPDIVGGTPDEGAKANALLWSASPKLLAACVRLHERWLDRPTDKPAKITAEDARVLAAAIDEAKGES